MERLRNPGPPPRIAQALHAGYRPDLRLHLQAGGGILRPSRFPPRTVERCRAAGPQQGGFAGMAEQFVGKLSEFQDGDRRIIFVGDNEIGVFRHEGQFYAYSNFCLHQGGPACEGLTIAKVEERIMPDKTSRGLYFSDTEMHFVCPWHGYEYDMKTGECVSDRKLKLRRYKVVEKEDGVYVVA
jgi:nitrite reductase/ring-hydroxylating ferredoxin subunit